MKERSMDHPELRINEVKFVYSLLGKVQYQIWR